MLSVYVVIPLMQRLDEYVELYEPALNETTPTIHVLDSRIEFEGHIPQQIILADSVQVLFDTVVNDSLFQTTPARSVFIAEDKICLKKEDDIDVLALENINIDSLVLRPLEVKKKLHQFRTLTYVIVAFMSVVFLFLIVLLVANFGAGIGIMIDAFANGPHTFKELLNVASLVLLFVILFWIIFSSGTLKNIKLALVIYFVLIAAFVYLNTLLSHAGRKDPTTKI